MSENSAREKFITCFNALGISNYVDPYNILFGELTRLDNDERIPEKKKTYIQVSSEEQKIIAETILILLKKQTQSTKKVLSQSNDLEIVVGEPPIAEQEPERVINLASFDYENEKGKFVSRCNSTIIGNAKIRDVLMQQDSEKASKSEDVGLRQEVLEIRSKGQELNDKIRKYEKSIFRVFRKKQIDQAYEERRILGDRLTNCQKRYETEKSYREYTDRKRRTRISDLFQKEDLLTGIKYVFTGIRENPVRRIDENGQVITTFVREHTQEEKRRSFRERIIKRIEEDEEQK